MGIFENRTELKHKLPVWFMRQAGRYHSHYQNIKKSSDFMTMCKTPDLACEVTMGPIEDFDFDAAILFSDLLFPLEHLGTGLKYAPGPKLDEKIQAVGDLSKLGAKESAPEFYKFQADALTLLREKLPQEKTLLGFVGSPFTLYTYAVEGAHTGSLFKAKRGLYNGLYQGFWELLHPQLIEEMKIQARGGADAICLFDTAVGELTKEDFINFILPHIKQLTSEFKKEFPDKKIIYYSRSTHLSYLQAIEDDNIDVLGVDWRHNLNDVMKELSNDYFIQGNFDPCWLHLSWKDCEKNLTKLVSSVNEKYWDKWIFGLGHGVLIETPEENVRNAVKFIHSL